VFSRLENTWKLIRAEHADPEAMVPGLRQAAVFKIEKDLVFFVFPLENKKNCLILNCNISGKALQ